MSGQQIFGRLGINPLVATGMGRRIAGYTFSKVGEEGIYKIVEEALRNPVKAAELIKRFRGLPDWVAPTKERVEPVLADPKAFASETYAEGKGRLKKAADFVGNALAKYSLDAIQRASVLGLIPAQREATVMTVEQDWEKGAPYLYRDNKLRAYIEAMEEDRGRHADAISNLTGAPPEAAPVSAPLSAPPNQERQLPPRRPMTTPINRNAVPGSSLAPTPQASAPQGQSNPETIAGLRDVGLDLFRGKEGGIVSVPCKPRQLVG